MGLGCPEVVRSQQQPNSFRFTGPHEAICFWKSAGRMRYPAPPTGRPKRGYHVVIPDSHAVSPDSVAISGVPPAVSRWLTYEIKPNSAAACWVCLSQPAPFGNCEARSEHLFLFFLPARRGRPEGTEQVVLADGPLQYHSIVMFVTGRVPFNGGNSANTGRVPVNLITV
jgi:hypothetical protein